MMLFRAVGHFKDASKTCCEQRKAAQANIRPEQGPAAWLAAPSTPESGDIPLIAGIME